MSRCQRTSAGGTQELIQVPGTREGGQDPCEVCCHGDSLPTSTLQQMMLLNADLLVVSAAVCEARLQDDDTLTQFHWFACQEAHDDI